MASNNLDTRMRLAAFERVRELNELHSHVTAKELKAGFLFENNRVPIVHPRRGIFKPQKMEYLLSIRTTIPPTARHTWYDDQIMVHEQIYNGVEAVDYAFMGEDPEASDNQRLKDAYENKIPIIYFLGIVPGRFQIIAPTFISGWDGKNLKAQIIFGLPDQDNFSVPPSIRERSYALRSVKQRLHQASFREAVITAYNGRCALSGLPEQRLLDAAHIVSDGNEQFGQPVVSNGLPLSKIHHAAFDAHLIGIDPDYRLHVSERLLAQRDGQMLEALKRLNGEKLHPPIRKKDYPDPERLAQRFEQFMAVT